MEERLQKYLAQCGIASRRGSEEIIKSGLVSVNGKTITDMGIKIDAEKDVVEYKGRVLKKENEKIYIMLNKPVGYVTTIKEQFGRPKVTDLINGIYERVYPVGRLDYNSSGLLILTNDGDLAYKLTHPGHEVDKKYIAEVEGFPDEEDINKLRQGVVLDGIITSPAKVFVLKKNESSCSLEIAIHEGRNRQVRRMCSAVGHNCLRLKRIAIGNLELGKLEKGYWRYLTTSEVNYLKNQV